MAASSDEVTPAPTILGVGCSVGGRCRRGWLQASYPVRSMWGRSPLERSLLVLGWEIWSEAGLLSAVSGAWSGWDWGEGNLAR